MRNLFRWLLLCGLLFFSILIFRSDDIGKPVDGKPPMPMIPSDSCAALLQKLNLSINVMLIDFDYLTVFNEKSCSWNESKPIKIGVDLKYRSEHLHLKGFDIYYYSNNPSKDYLDFTADGVRRLIPRRFETYWIGNIEIPKDVERFGEFWKRSKFIDCLGLDMKRNATEKPFMNAPTATNILARFRDDLLDNGMFPFLNGGTFLGWYRECTVISHTTDMDFAVFKENYNSKYADKILYDGESQFRLVRKLGKLEDSQELTVALRHGGSANIDLFVMYEGVEDGELQYHYVSGLSSDGTKYRYKYPVYDPWCAAEMHNHMFWVSCSPEIMLEAEYGPKWRLDHPTARFSWSSSHSNVKPSGKFTKEEMRKYYLFF